ncbi:DeoR/GlpR transcriptional regulator [Roseospira marina]|uniref:DeoR/GlpR transcriptional regulator n=1 Tax=Roseospira marina TaxID=140057 RepID=A0A5M6IAB9_9PROT|nr:DeoR/GlpR family DNA-binding transcription regulator [Roseospira marina]KAA5605214.1 DeoR/GlpR transcriptional regulator [Roseospira marina]MBB4314669.1 DeoR family glycerol-3-phosphate regulon repressor [Roseospira marina]MBB5087658.1 DeoR family glycerol-3-phosphate regulon repressor [Roseospira marina]
METLSPRQSDILAMARRDGRVTVDGLSAHFGMTPQTIRRDLNELCERQLLKRTHGGAMFPSGVSNLRYDARRTMAADGKRSIGRRVAELIPDNCSTMLNIGTTTEQVAVALRAHEGLMTVTNNINVANILRDAPGVDVVIAGGVLRPFDGGIIGDATVAFLSEYKVDFAVIGASAIDPEDGTVLDYDHAEVRAARAILTHARKTILVADNMKFARSAPLRIAPLTDIDIFVTDRPPPDAIRVLCGEGGVRLEVTETEEDPDP